MPEVAPDTILEMLTGTPGGARAAIGAVDATPALAARPAVAAGDGRFNGYIRAVRGGPDGRGGSGAAGGAVAAPRPGCHPGRSRPRCRRRPAPPVALLMRTSAPPPGLVWFRTEEAFAPVTAVAAGAIIGRAGRAARAAHRILLEGQCAGGGTVDIV